MRDFRSIDPPAWRRPIPLQAPQEVEQAHLRHVILEHGATLLAITSAAYRYIGIDTSPAAGAFGQHVQTMPPVSFMRRRFPPSASVRGQALCPFYPIVP